MKTRFTKTMDKIMYIVAMAIAFITIAVITYCIILGVMSRLNTLEYSKILIDANLYTGFYKILNIVNSFALPLILLAFFFAIPYLSISIIVFIYFIIRYIKYKEKNTKKMIILLSTLGLAIFLLIKGITTYPMTGTYETNINSKISEISNIEMKDFITEKMKVYNNGIAYSNKVLEEDYYIYNIIIKQGFPDDYDGVIYYKEDGIKKEKRIFVGDDKSSFIRNNMQDKTNELSIKGIFLLVIGDILYIVFIAILQKVLKRIVKNNENINITENEDKNKIEKILFYILFLVLLIGIIFLFFIILTIFKNNNSKNNYNSNNIDNTYLINKNENLYLHETETSSNSKKDILYEKKIDENIIVRVVNLDYILAQRSIVGIEKSNDGGLTFEKMYNEGITIHNGAEFYFINENVGFINDFGLAGTNGDNKFFKVTIDGGRNFSDANIIFPNITEEESFFVKGVPYMENGILKVQAHIRNKDYTFYSSDNGVNWNIDKE